MGLFDKFGKKKEEKAAEAAELLALCNRLRQNEIFLNYADRLYATLSDPNNANIQWALGKSAEQKDRCLAILVTPKAFALVKYYGYDQPFRDPNGIVLNRKLSDYETIDRQQFMDYGMQELPDKDDVKTAVLETLASRLKEISYLTMTRQPVRIYNGKTTVMFDAIQINVSGKSVQSQFTAW